MWCPLRFFFEDTQTKKQFTQDIKAPVTALGGNSKPMQP
jgi:hypothetical protein